MELTGFEPVTPSLRTRCSARLSYSPIREPQIVGAVLTEARSSVDAAVVAGPLLIAENVLLDLARGGLG